MSFHYEDEYLPVNQKQQKNRNEQQGQNKQRQQEQKKRQASSRIRLNSKNNEKRWASLRVAIFLLYGINNPVFP